MEAYKVDDIIVGYFGDKSPEVIEHQFELMEAMDSILYKHFEEALEQGQSVFQITLNDVLIYSMYQVKEGKMFYTADRQDNKEHQYYRFLVDLDNIDNCELSDDVTEARVVTLWLLDKQLQVM